MLWQIAEVHCVLRIWCFFIARLNFRIQSINFPFHIWWYFFVISCAKRRKICLPPLHASHDSLVYARLKEHPFVLARKLQNGFQAY